MIPKFSESPAWEVWETLFPGLDYRGELPRRINDFFAEQDWSDVLGIEGVDIRIAQTAKTIFFRVLSCGHKLTAEKIVELKKDLDTTNMA